MLEYCFVEIILELSVRDFVIMMCIISSVNLMQTVVNLVTVGHNNLLIDWLLD